MNDFLFKVRDGQTPLPPELRKGLKVKTIQTMGELDEYEEDNIALGLAWLLRQQTDPVSFDFWLKLHKRLFGSVWSWAGTVRKHDPNDPEFTEPHKIWTELYALEKDLQLWVKEQTYPPMELVARFHERLLRIHPFSNGNGRFSRILAEYFCKFHNYPEPTWGRTYQNNPRERRRVYIDALLQGRREQEYQPLATFIFSFSC